MDIEMLLEKKEKYLALQAQIEEHNYTNEINEELEKYKQQLISKFETQRTRELGKVGAYLECINELLVDMQNITNNEEDSISEENN